MQGRIKQMINGKDQEIITINKTGNSILNNAKYSADNTDEWYTTYETIAEELSHYKNQFIDKVVLCNCDDPFESNFCYYFLRHFNQLKTQKTDMYILFWIQNRSVSQWSINIRSFGCGWQSSY